MAENKAEQALREAKYSAKLILGSDPEHGSKIIDITEPVITSVGEDISLTDSNSDFGIAYKIIGIIEQAQNPNYTHTPPLYTHRNDFFLMQDIRNVLEASIVNAKQLEAIEKLIEEVFKKHDRECMDGIDYVLREHLGDNVIE